MSKKVCTFKSGSKAGMGFDGQKIIRVDAGGQADQAGVKVGWKIADVNGKIGTTTKEVTSSIQAGKKGGDTYKITFTAVRALGRVEKKTSSPVVRKGVATKAPIKKALSVARSPAAKKKAGEAEAKHKVAEEAKKKAEEETKKKQEEETKKKEEEETRKKEEEAKIKAEEEAKKKEEEEKKKNRGGSEEASSRRGGEKIGRRGSKNYRRNNHEV